MDDEWWVIYSCVDIFILFSCYLRNILNKWRIIERSYKVRSFFKIQWKKNKREMNKETNHWYRNIDTNTNYVYHPFILLSSWWKFNGLSLKEEREILGRGLRPGYLTGRPACKLLSAEALNLPLCLTSRNCLKVPSSFLSNPITSLPRVGPRPANETPIKEGGGGVW